MVENRKAPWSSCGKDFAKSVPDIYFFFFPLLSLGPLRFKVSSASSLMGGSRDMCSVCSWEERDQGGSEGGTVMSATMPSDWTLIP